MAVPVRTVRPAEADDLADSMDSAGMSKVVADLRSDRLWSKSRVDRRAVSSTPLPPDMVYNSWLDTQSSSASAHASNVDMVSFDERRRPQQQQLRQQRRQLVDEAAVDAVAAAPAGAVWWARRYVRPADSGTVSNRHR